MSTIYEVMHHNFTHHIKESGVHTSIHPVCPCPRLSESEHPQETPTAYALQYHATDVITAYPDGRIILRSGGWMTPTTKERINRYLIPGCQLYQKKGAWYVTMYGKPDVKFSEGIVIGPGWSALEGIPA
jgi:hypothetical protein